MTHEITDYRVELSRSDLGDGGWSLHAVSADGAEFPLLTSGESEMLDGVWERPTAADYEQAQQRALELAQKMRLERA